MAFSANTKWRVRVSGSDSNGGGYDGTLSGATTDYSNQALPAFSPTDLGVTNASATVTTASASTNWIGNCINILGVPYQVVGASSGVSVTLDKVYAGSTASGVSGNVGGAFGSPGMALGYAVASNTIYQKAGSYVCSDTPNVSGGKASPNAAGLHWIGYDVTPGDRTGNKPVMTGTSVTTSLLSFADTACLENLKFDAGTNNAAAVSSTTPGVVVLIDCDFNANNGVNPIVNCTFRMSRCQWIQAGTGARALETAGTFAAVDCYFSANTASGAALDLRSMSAMNDCVISNPTGEALFITSGHDGSGLFHSCTLEGVIGLQVGNAASSPNILKDCLFRNCSTAAVNMDSSVVVNNQLTLTDNRYFNCAAHVVSVNGVSYYEEGAVDLTGDPNTSAATLDYSLNNTAGAGASCRSIPRVIAGTLTTSYPDAGAAQHATPALGLSVNTTGTNPVLTWDADPRAVTGYVILRGATAAALTEIATVGLVTTYTDTTVSSGTYVYSVASY